MSELRAEPSQDEAATRIQSDMPGHVASEAELLAALSLGDADIEAGRTLSFEDVTALLRRGRATG